MRWGIIPVIGNSIEKKGDKIMRAKFIGTSIISNGGIERTLLGRRENIDLIGR